MLISFEDNSLSERTLKVINDKVDSPIVIKMLIKSKSTKQNIDLKNENAMKQAIIAKDTNAFDSSVLGFEISMMLKIKIIAVIVV